MRRKKLLEFAAWLAGSRKRFDMTDPTRCVAGYARMWGGLDGDHIPCSGDLVDMFDIDVKTARDLYLCETVKSKPWREVSRMDAVRALRNVANGRKKIWDC